MRKCNLRKRVANSIKKKMRMKLSKKNKKIKKNSHKQWTLNLFKKAKHVSFARLFLILRLDYF